MMKTPSDIQQVRWQDHVWDQFSRIRKSLENNVNIFAPEYVKVVQDADQKGHLNGELPTNLRDVVQAFVPAIAQTLHTTVEPSKANIMPRNLSRQKRKEWKQNHPNVTETPNIWSPVYSTALEKIKTQVFSAITLSKDELHKYYNHASVNEISKFDTLHHISLLSSLSIPHIVFEWVDPKILRDYTDAYMQQKETVQTQYNFIWDLIRAKAIPIIKELLKTKKENELLWYEEHIKYQIQFSRALKEVYERWCFANEVPVQPWYIGRVFKNELSKANIKADFKEIIEWQPIHKFLNWIFAEAYGNQAIIYFAERAKECNINIRSISLADDTKTSLDFYAKSDEQYYISLPNQSEFLQTVDFKSYADWEPSIIPIQNDNPAYNKRLHTIRRYVPEQLQNMPIHAIDFRVWVPSYFKGKLYTQGVFEHEFEMLYQKYMGYIASMIFQPK